MWCEWSYLPERLGRNGMGACGASVLSAVWTQSLRTVPERSPKMLFCQPELISLLVCSPRGSSPYKKALSAYWFRSQTGFQSKIRESLVHEWMLILHFILPGLWVITQTNISFLQLRKIYTSKTFSNNTSRFRCLVGPNLEIGFSLPNHILYFFPKFIEIC